MKIKDIFEKEQPGTFAGVRFSKANEKTIMKYIKDNDIPNPVKPDEIHATLLYSKKHLPDYKARGNIDPPIQIKSKGFHTFPQQEKRSNGDTIHCLVLLLNSPELEKRHKFLMNKHNASYDFDEYIPHLTLSYDMGNIDIDKLPKITDKLEIVNEYQEELKTHE